MRRLLLIGFLIYSLPLTVLATDFSGSIAIELQEQGRFIGVIGKVHISKSSPSRLLRLLSKMERLSRLLSFMTSWKRKVDQMVSTILNAEIN